MFEQNILFVYNKYHYRKVHQNSILKSSFFQYNYDEEIIVIMMKLFQLK